MDGAVLDVEVEGKEGDEAGDDEEELDHHSYLSDLTRLRALEAEDEDGGGGGGRVLERVNLARPWLRDEQALCQRWTRMVGAVSSQVQVVGAEKRGERESLFDIVRSM